MMLQRIIQFFLQAHFLFFIPPLIGQDINYARKVVDTLTSISMHGRGYVNHGDKVAASYIENEFQAMGLKPFKEKYFQEFYFSINTFPDTINVAINEEYLSPGVDYLILPNTTTVHGVFDCIWLNKSIINDKRKLRKFKKTNFSKKIIIVDDKEITEKEQLDFIKTLSANPLKAAGIIVLKDKLTWKTSRDTVAYIGLEILRDKMYSFARIPQSPFPEDLKIALDIKNKFIKNYTSQNVIAHIKGSIYPDSFIVFSAHYDHLGQMGTNTYFPGANDNASGTAMLLNLAKYYSQPENKPDFSLTFMAFGAEEVGLVGSKYYTENPLFPLKNIKFVLNMDIMGTGDEGITVVNATKHQDEYNSIVRLNATKNYLKEVKSRGQTKNSDHYSFSEKGVKAFYIYTMGGIKAYHDIYDKSQTLPLTEFEDIHLLIIDFIDYLQNNLSPKK